MYGHITGIINLGYSNIPTRTRITVINISKDPRDESAVKKYSKKFLSGIEYEPDEYLRYYF